MNADEYTLDEKWIEVSDGHRLYAQLWGSSEAAEPIIFLHGGPGSGCSDSHKSRFDPSRHKVLFFDQRGAGKSTPYGLLEANTTENLIEDISILADEFGLDRFTLVGGSWGSCLALIYALKNPQRVSRMVLSGIFTARKKEIDFLNSGGAQIFFPEAWEAFTASVPETHRAHPASYHLPRLFDADPAVAKASAYELYKFQSSSMRLDDRIQFMGFEDFNATSTIIEGYYMTNNCFLPESYILEYAGELKMPITIIQGRYDAICPPWTAYALHKKLPNSRIHWTLSGHSGSDRATWDAVKISL